MKEAVQKEILKDVTATIVILERGESRDTEQLRELSDQAIEDVALYKDLDMISITVLIYSIYKIVSQITKESYQELLKELRAARKHLQSNNFGSYNRSIKKLFQITQASNAVVKEHLQDVMQAARIKKGAVLLQKGLSIGQAAGLMGLSNWDLQQYAAHTPALSGHQEKVPARRRLETAFTLFEVRK